MVTFIVIIVFIIFHGEELFALPLQESQRESASLFLGEVSSSDEQLQWATYNTSGTSSVPVINISTIQDGKPCIPPVFSSVFIDMGCKSKIVYDDFQENRIPQLLPQIKCVTSLPSLRYRSKRIRTVCEEVRYSLPVIYRISADGAKVMLYKSTVDSVSVACIRNRQPSPIVEKLSAGISIEM